MRRLRLCFLLGAVMSVLLWMTAAMGDTCPHAEYQELHFEKGYYQVEGGHEYYEQRLSKCLDCGRKVPESKRSSVTGHYFQMAENVHFTTYDFHVMIFVCKQCHYMMIREEVCDGGEHCIGKYLAEDRVVVPVKTVDTMSEWLPDAASEEIIQRWLGQQR